MRLAVDVALSAAALTLTSASIGPVRFESKPRAVASGIFPQIGVRVTGDLSLLTVEGGDLWYLTSLDGGDSFPTRVRVNDAAHEVAPHGENIPLLFLRSMRELYVLWQGRSSDHKGSVLRLARSVDWGGTFSKPIVVDPGSDSQGFYTMGVSPNGTIYVAWLDGRERGGEGVGLYVARSADRGVTFESSVRVASSVCPCCRPSVAFSGGGETPSLGAASPMAMSAMFRLPRLWMAAPRGPSQRESPKTIGI
jgi:hypothetical protein